MKSIDAENLGLFFNRLQTAWHKDNQGASHKRGLDTTRLKAFFDVLRTCDFGQAETADKTKQPVPRVEIDAQGLQLYFDKIKPEIEITRTSGGFCNPWVVAKLGRNEVRNTAVLSWLLNPAGDHGLDAVLLNALLDYAHDHPHKQFPARDELSHGLQDISVKTEVCPVDDRSNRFDIEIKSRSFYVLLESKIDAPEGKEQLKRYLELAEKIADTRPWLVFFLTPGGWSASTADHEKIIPISWRTLATVLARAVRKYSREGHGVVFNVRLALLFLDHVKRF